MTFHVFEKRRSVAALLSLSVSLIASPAAFGGLSPAQASVPKLVAEAAKFQPGDSREAFQRLEDLVRKSISDSSLRDSVEEGLINLLAPSSTFEARRFACKELGIIGGKAALPAIGNLLKNNDTAGIACLALTTYPPGKADDLLRAALPAASGSARLQIINTLGDRRDDRSVKSFSQLAKGSDPAVAAAAIDALAKIGDKSAWEALTTLRRGIPAASAGPMNEAALRCAANLAVSGDRKAAASAYETLLGANELPYVRRAAFAGLVRLDKDGGEARILQTLKGADATLKPVAIAAIQSLPAKDASVKFAAQISTLQPQEQAWLIETLAVRGDVPARNAIASSLASSDATVRRAAIAALSRIGDVSTVGLLARALPATPDAEERRAIEAALIGLRGGNQVDQAVVVELKNASGNARATLISVLARRQGPAANIVLFEETANADPLIVKAALRALAGTTAGGDVPAFLRIVINAKDEAIRAEAENAVAQALIKIDDVGDRSTLVRESLRTAPSVDVVTSLLALLPKCGDPSSLTILQAAQSDPNPKVRDSAIRALVEWPNDSAWDSLASIYRRPANDTVRKLALTGLVRMVGEENAQPNAKLLGHYRELIDSAREDSDYRLVLGALGSAADPDALQIALPLLAKESVRPEAEAAVRKIAEAIKAKHPDAAADALEKLKQKS